MTKLRNVAFAVSMLAAGAAGAQELPETLAATAYDVGAVGYGQAVAISAAFKQNLGTTLRILPGKNDASRMAPLRDGKVDFSFNGMGTYYSIEVLDIFASPDWGPQDLRILYMVIGDTCNSMVTAKTSNIESFAALRGRKVVQVKGSPALNQNTVAHLAFGGLTWDDVEPVVVGGNSAGFSAIINNQADAFISTTNSGNVLQLVGSPVGAHFPPLPHDDEEGWARLKKVAPFMSKHICRESSANPPPWEGVTYPYPILTMYTRQSADLAYAITKAVVDQYPHYKDSAPGASGYALDRQIFDWVVPFHEGAIRYFTEAGIWDAEKQEHQDALLDRGETIRRIWAEFLKTSPQEAGFREAWMAYRFDALTDAGLDPVYRTF